jgi:hypothetical protein
MPAYGEAMTPSKLAEILRLHKLWLKGDTTGQCADLRYINLSRADLSRADLRNADLRDADLRGADLRNADLRNADLRGADLRNADLRDADLRGADLRNANLSNADLREADLRNANLSRAYLYYANLRGAYLSEGLIASTVRAMDGLYKYPCWAVVASDGTPWVRMGCLWKTVEEWDRIGIRNSNPEEFKRESSEDSARRARTFYFVREEALILAKQFKRASA